MRNRRLVLSIVVLVVVVGAGAAYVWRESRPISVTTSAAATTDVTVGVLADGTVNSSSYTDVYPAAAGTITRVAVSDGTAVEPGDVLVELDAAPLTADLDRAYADLKKAQALPRSTNSQKRVRDASIKAATASIEVAQQQLDAAVIRAPQKGLVQLNSTGKTNLGDGNLTVASGMAVTPASLLMRVYSPSELQFRARVSEVDLVGLENGASMIVNLDAAPNRPLSSTIKAIGQAPLTSSGSSVYPVDAPITGADWVRVGMSGTATISKALQGQVVVPPGAIASKSGVRYVYRVENGVVRAVQVDVGETTEGQTIVTSGVSSGDILATSNLDALSDGTKVSPQ